LFKDLNIRPETLKLLQEGAVNTLYRQSLPHRTPATQQLRERKDKWHFIKL
jgi:hypothetical protein